MPDWDVKVERRADRELGHLSGHVKHEALEILEFLADDPFPPGFDIGPMRRYINAYRLKFADEAYRMLYQVDQKRRRIRVFAIGPRPTIYKGLKNP